MIAAIRAMLESRSEHRPKTDPLVGAVLVFPNGKFIEAHRGHYGSGDHGEFSLLEKSGELIPAGSTLYVTLEPCSKRGDGKTPCADRIIAAGIGHVVIGIHDPNPDIYGEGEARLKREGIQVNFFDDDLAQQVRDYNSDFLKEQEERAERLKSMRLKSPSREENRRVPEASVADFSLEAIRTYLKEIKKVYKVPSAALWSEFKKLGFLSQGSNRKNLIPTVAGLVLFAKRPHVFLPQCRIRANVFVGSPSDSTFVEKSRKQLDLTGPLFTQVTAALELFHRSVEAVPRIMGAVTEHVPEYPPKVIREAIINALVHRDYQVGSTIFFQMYRDRIVVKSPGGPVEPLTIDMFPYGVRDTSIPRNPKLAQAAFEMRLMDARGFGVSNMPARLREWGLRDPTFAVDRGFFVITLYGREATSLRIRTDQATLEKLNRRQLQLLDLFDQRNALTSPEWARLGKITRQTAKADLDLLCRLGILQRVGTGKSTSYRAR
jgi:ATP-dependent DNA helicase RecG